jgi:hypothetical protein
MKIRTPEEIMEVVKDYKGYGKFCSSEASRAASVDTVGVAIVKKQAILDELAAEIKKLHAEFSKLVDGEDDTKTPPAPPLGRPVGTGEPTLVPATNYSKPRPHTTSVPRSDIGFPRWNGTPIRSYCEETLAKLAHKSEISIVEVKDHLQEISDRFKKETNVGFAPFSNASRYMLIFAEEGIVERLPYDLRTAPIGRPRRLFKVTEYGQKYLSDRYPELVNGRV